jgi:hypothetical protein
MTELPLNLFFVLPIGQASILTVSPAKLKDQNYIGKKNISIFGQDMAILPYN